MTRNDLYSISLVAEEDKNITQMIKYITDKYEGDIKRIDIELIEQDKNSTFYQGTLKVELE